MLNQDHLQRYADILLWGMQTAREQTFDKGDIVLIRYDLPARPLCEILFEKLLRQGLNPIQRLNGSPGMEQAFFSIADSRQLRFVPPGEEELMHHLNGAISLLAPESLTHLQHVNPEHIGTSIVARKKLRDILDNRENNGEFGWTLCLLPTPELAVQAGLSEEAYAQQIIQACYLDSEDPVKHWRDIYEKAGTIKDRLNTLAIESLHLESERCDLKVTPGGQRKWVGISGHNIPSFEIFTSPDWHGTEGTYFMDQPSFRSGNLVKDLELQFAKGCVTSVKASQGEDFVKKQLELDQNSNKIGEFSLTDIRFSRIDRFMAHTLFDENFGGTHGNCHIALGASYAETYRPGAAHLSADLKKELGFNDSALHWDLVNTEPKKVTATLTSGETEVIYENGKFSTAKGIS